jgi:hypothetical protein
VQELRAMAGVDYRVVVGKMEEKDMLEEEERKKKNKMTNENHLLGASSHFLATLNQT